MSNLSDLLPAGGGAKVITATASGNLATGQTVILNSNGTVSVVAAVSESVSSQSTYVTTASAEQNTATYDSTNNRLVVIYKDGSDGDSGKAVVGTVSGSSISFGTPVQFETGNTAEPDVDFDVSAGKVVIVYADNGDSQKGKAVVGTVDPSDNSISFGSIAEFNSGTTRDARISYNANHSKNLIVYGTTGGSNLIKARVGTISGTSISFGTEVSVTSGEGQKPGVAYDTSTYAHLVVYEDDANSQYGTARVATISGTDVSFGTAVVFNSGTTQEQKVAYDSGNNKFVASFTDQSDSNYGKAIVGTISGTDVSFGTEVAYESSGEAGDNYIVYDATAGKVVVFYTFSSDARYAVGTVSGTSISFAAPVSLTDNIGGVPISFGLTYDSTAGVVIFVYRSTDSNNRGGAKILTVAGTNSSDFAGITNQAINNSASGEVVVEGGVITNGSLLPPLTTASYGSEVVFEAGYMRYPAIVYDTVNDKIVIAYADYGDSNKGKAVVGTVSGTSISYGSIVEFNSGSTDYVTAVFDASAGKVVIGYRDAGNSNYGTAIVGTVSGTSISFGTEVVFESASSMYIKASYDTNASKTLFVYNDGSNSDVLTAQVGTVSGTSISFGGASALNSVSSVYIAVAYDSTAQKHVVFFANGANSNRGDAGVVTIVGTSVSVGSFTTGVAANVFYTAVAYDANANKSVIFFSDADNSNIGKAIIGTVSGTSISVGTAVTWNSTIAGFSATPAFYDPTTTKVIIGYLDSDDSNKGKTKIGTVDGDTITFGDAVVFNSTSTSGGEIAITKDTDNNKLVIAYRDSGNSNYGTSVVGTLSTGIPNFTIGSTYYVQDDGTLSTTSSSVTAGKAIANTTLLLKG